MAYGHRVDDHGKATPVTDGCSRLFWIIFWLAVFAAALTFLNR